MCIFSQTVDEVSATKIYVSDSRRDVPWDRRFHVTVYQADIAVAKPVAMILPVPGAQLQFINLQGYDNFFKDLDELFPQPTERSKGLVKSRSTGKTLTLTVVEVGDYVASFVPSMDDFDRLDPLFQLPDGCWQKLPDYSLYGFAVFHLKPDAKGLSKTYHPMAYRYLPFNPNQLFFPTSHVHDCNVEPVSDYNHMLYMGCSRRFCDEPLRWETSSTEAQSCVDIHKSKGLISSAQRVARRNLRNVRSNNGDYIVIRHPRNDRCIESRLLVRV